MSARSIGTPFFRTGAHFDEEFIDFPGFFEETYIEETHDEPVEKPTRINKKRAQKAKPRSHLPRR
jgi:hypothetical protein